MMHAKNTSASHSRKSGELTLLVILIDPLPEFNKQQQLLTLTVLQNQ